MDNNPAVTGPYLASTTVQHCDIGNHPMSPGQQWWLLTDTSRGWHNHTGAVCAAHLPNPNPNPIAEQGYLYRVGDMFDPERSSWPQGPHLWLDNDGDTRLAIFLNNPSRTEIRAVESGASRFAWTEQGVNGFLLFKFGVLPWNDAPFNPQRLRQPFRTQPAPAGTHSRTFTFLVNADTGRIAAMMRMSTWPAYFHNHITDSVHRLAARPPYTETAAHSDQQDFYRRYPDGPSLYHLARTLNPQTRCVGGQRDDHPH